MAMSLPQMRDPLQTSPKRRRPRGRPKKAKDDDYIARLFAKTVTGPYKQDAACLLEGQKGSGKSHSSLRIAYNTGRRIAEILDGDWHEWPRYFNMGNVAIIDPNRAFEIMSEAKPHSVLLYDDIGVGWNARAFASKENRDKNDIFQISRINETAQIMSMPHQMLIDKVPRMLCNFKAEMDKPYFSSGYTSLRFFRTKTVYRVGTKQITPHLVSADGEKITRHLIYRPPKFLSDKYDRIRQEVTEKIIAERARQISEEEMTQTVPEEKRLSPQSVKMYERAAKALPRYEECRLSGMSHKEALREVRIPIQTWYNWKHRGVLSHYGLGEI